jgi:DNA-binding beta-propeller fold protein YncE
MLARFFCAIAATVVLASCGPNAGITSAPSAVPATRGVVTRESHCINAIWSCASLGSFGDPYGVGVNPRCTAQCDVYVADPGSKKVWKVSPDGSRTAIGAFPATNFDPQSVAVSPDGDVYVADKANCYYWKVKPDGATSYVLVYSNCRPTHQYVRGVTVDGRGQVYLCIALGPLGQLDFSGDVRQVAGFNDGFPYTKLPDPYSVAANVSGTNIFVVDAKAKAAYRIYKEAGSNGVWQIVQLGKTFSDPYGVAVDSRNDFVYVADAGDKRVWQGSPSGWSVIGVFADPYGVAVDGAGNLYVADPGSKQVFKLSNPG